MTKKDPLFWGRDLMVLILSAKEIQRVISMNQAIDAVKRAYVDFANGNANVPKRTTIEVPETNGIALVLPSYLSTMGVFGAKLVSVFFDNPKHGLPLVSAVILLHDGKTGKPIAIMDGSLPTAIKTGAATGAATDALARKDVGSVGLIGTGYQAPWQLEAVCEVRPQIREILVFDVDQEKSKAFSNRMNTFLSRFQIRLVQVESPEEAVREKDIIITVTTSTTPVFDGHWIREGAHINAVGSFTPEMQEVDETTIMRAEKVVTDMREDALEMAGDLITPIRKGIVSEDVIYGEIGEILSGKKLGREREDEITLFESIGLSALDVAVARTIHQNALKMGIGQQVDLH